MDYLEGIEKLTQSGKIIISTELLKSINNMSAILVYSDLIVQYAQFLVSKKLTAEGYFYCAVTRLKERTNLAKKTQQRSLDRLEKLGLIDLKYITTKNRTVRYIKVVSEKNTALDLIDIKVKGKSTSEVKSEKAIAEFRQDLDQNKLDTKDLAWYYQQQHKKIYGRTVTKPSGKAIEGLIQAFNTKYIEPQNWLDAISTGIKIYFREFNTNPDYPTLTMNGFISSFAQAKLFPLIQDELGIAQLTKRTPTTRNYTKKEREYFEKNYEVF